MDEPTPVALLETLDPPTGENEPDYEHDEDDDELTLREDDDQEGDQ